MTTKTEISQEQLLDVLNAAMKRIDELESAGALLADRVNDLEPLVRRLLPREGMAPPEAWAKLSKEGIIATAIQGAVMGALVNVPISNFNKENVRQSYINNILAFADDLLVSCMKRMNQTPREPKSGSSKSSGGNQ